MQERPRPWREVLEPFLAAGRGLAAAHEAGLIHRDEGPECAHLERELAGIWDDSVRQRVRQALEGTRLDYAPATADRVFQTLEGYTRTWARMRTEACEEARDQAGEPRSACTGRSRAPIPGQGEHRFRSKVSTDSGDAERAFRAR